MLIIVLGYLQTSRLAKEIASLNKVSFLILSCNMNQ